MALGVVFCLFSGPSAAQKQSPDVVTGVPVVQASGQMIIGGKKIELWGIDTIAPDQQCWQGETAWCCGEEATSALRHYVDGRMVECHIQSRPEDSPPLAKCFRQKGHARKDISEHLVRQGWALDRGETSGGAYFAAEEDAQKNKRGVWSGRFQTAKDWKDGIQRYVGEAPPEEHTEPTGEEDEE